MKLNRSFENLIVCFIGTTHSKCSMFDRNVKFVDTNFSLPFIKSYLSKKSSPISLWKGMHGKASFIQLVSKSPLLLPLPPLHFLKTVSTPRVFFKKSLHELKKKQLNIDGLILFKRRHLILCEFTCTLHVH